LPNVLTLGSAALALIAASSAAGWAGVGAAAIGWLIGLAIFFPVFFLRGMGGGDVKLMAALGAWLGVPDVLRLALFTALAGGVLALLVASRRGYARKLVANVLAIVTFWRVMGMQPHPIFRLDAVDAPQRLRLPYAIPIAVGLLVTLWLR